MTDFFYRQQTTLDQVTLLTAVLVWKVCWLPSSNIVQEDSCVDVGMFPKVEQPTPKWRSISDDIPFLFHHTTIINSSDIEDEVYSPSSKALRHKASGSCRASALEWSPSDPRLLLQSLNLPVALIAECDSHRSIFTSSIPSPTLQITAVIDAHIVLINVSHADCGSPPVIWSLLLQVANSGLSEYLLCPI
jgi:hypothetical protein